MGLVSTECWFCVYDSDLGYCASLVVDDFVSECATFHRRCTSGDGDSDISDHGICWASGIDVAACTISDQL